MTKAAVLMIEGYEESETMQIVDLLRRAEIETHTFRFQEDPFVYSMQGMYVKADKVFSDEVMNMLRWFNDNNMLIAAMCSGTKVLEAAGVLKGKTVTGYTGYGEVLKSAGKFVEDVAVFDQNVITSQGPATPYPFAFKIMEACGIDPSPLKERLLYHFAGGK